MVNKLIKTGSLRKIIYYNTQDIHISLVIHQVYKLEKNVLIIYLKIQNWLNVLFFWQQTFQ